jgi:hypothetical protein
VIGNAVLAIAIFDLLAVGRDGDAVERCHELASRRLLRNRIIINFNGKGSRMTVTGKCDGNHKAAAGM